MSITSKWNYKDRSFWVDDVLANQPDVTIVGAGIVGVNAAIEIKTIRPDWTVEILEKGSGADAASVRNAGFACFGSVSEILDDIDNFGEETAIDIVTERVKGLSILTSRVSTGEMNYDACGGYEVFDSYNQFKVYQDQLGYVNSLISGIVDENECFTVKHHPIFGDVIWNKYEGALQPAKMMNSLIRKATAMGVQIHYNVDVKSINRERKQLYTSCGDITYSSVIFCTNAWTRRVGLHVDVSPARNQVMITKPIEGLRIKGTFHMDKGFVYFRNVGNRILIGGRRNLDEVGEMTLNTVPSSTLILEALDALLRSRILEGKKVEIDRTWTGHLGVGKDKRPMVKQLEESVWVAVKMGGMGVAIGSYIGRKIAIMIGEGEATTEELNR